MSFTTTSAPITRGELAKRSGCHLETVRYYEKIGLLPPPARAAGGHRLYQIDDQRCLRFILRGRELGFSIDHLESVRQKIAELKRLERTLDRISNEYSGGAVPECPVIDALWGD